MSNNSQLVPPDSLTPPDSKPPSDKSGKQRLIWFFAALVLVLAAVAAYELLWLPRVIETRNNADESISHKKDAAASKANFPEQQEKDAGGNAAAPVQAVKSETVKQEVGKDEARNLAFEMRQEWYEKKAEAELENMPVYGEADYARALDVASKASEQMERQEFSRAVSSFKQAITIISRIRASRQDILSASIKAGSQALENGDGPEAVRHFRKALAIVPDNAVALKGIKRAGTIDTVHAMILKGRALLEKEKDFDAAQAVFKKALEIDPQCSTARDLLEHAREQAQRQRFSKLMGRAMSDLAAGRYNSASRAVAEARAIFPDDSAAGELSTRIETERKAAEFNRSLQAARNALSKEQWQQAIQGFRRALKLDPLSVEAKHGLSQAEKALALQNALQKIVRNPWSLGDKGSLEDAKAAVRAALNVSGAGPELRRLTAEAQDILRKWQKKVTVVFVSDDATDVVIYRLGRLGKFKRRSLRLRPGIYTVSGMREGYRDVLLKVRIPPGADGKQIRVRCTEKIL